MEREFVLVNQGIEIFRTKDQEKALEMITKNNEDCYKDDDDYIELHVEYNGQHSLTNRDDVKRLLELMASRYREFIKKLENNIKNHENDPIYEIKEYRGMATALVILGYDISEQTDGEYTVTELHCNGIRVKV